MANHRSKAAQWARDYILKIDLERGWFHFTDIECVLPSGRKFRYQMQDYPFRVDATPDEIDAIAEQIIKDKYRYCQWDREHSQTNQEVEIFDAIKTFMQRQVAEAQELRTRLVSQQKAEGTLDA